MKPLTLSASAISCFETCEARFRTEYVDKVQAPQTGAARLGSAVHDMLEQIVKQGIDDRPDVSRLIIATGMRFGLDEQQMDDALDMAMKWFDRTVIVPANVLSTETKHFFILKSRATAERIKINYIFDRCDRIEDGIEVIDYKTVGRPISPDMMRSMVQPRLYGVAAALQYKDILGDNDVVWVTYDLLRYEPVSVRFSRTELNATYNYLRDAYDRVLASDGTVETINGECNWCARKGECTAIDKYKKAGGLYGSTPAQAVLQWDELGHAIKALYALRDEAETIIMDAFDEAEDATEILGPDGRRAIIAASKRREVTRPDVAAQIIGPENIIEVATVGVTMIDKLIKEGKLTKEQRADLELLIKTNVSGKVKVLRS